MCEHVTVVASLLLLVGGNAYIFRTNMTKLLGETNEKTQLFWGHVKKQPNFRQVAPSWLHPLGGGFSSEEFIVVGVD